MNVTWKVAGVQMDVRLGDPAANLEAMRGHLSAAAARGARLVVFPECALTGYGVATRAEAERLAEPVPGPATGALAAECARLGVFAAFGLLERDGARLFNACALVGPAGLVGVYRKLHLPCVGADRFTDPGDRPFAVYDLGGLVVGLNICFDGSFPECARIMTLLGADLILLPTNWAEKAKRTAELSVPARAWENHVYAMSVNRVGDEGGYHYIGMSSAADYHGTMLAMLNHDKEEIFTIDVDPAAARAKRVVHCVGEYEIDRVNWRRPEMYGPLTATPGAHPRGPHAEARPQDSDLRPT